MDGEALGPNGLGDRGETEPQSLALHVRTYCMLYVLALKNRAEHIR
jgi:hypothetical protein